LSETNTPAPAPAPTPAQPSPSADDMQQGYSEMTTISAGPEQIRMWSVSKVLEFNGLIGPLGGRGIAGVVHAAAELEDYVTNGKPAAPAAA
jgi:hypothetical protein